MPLHNVRITAGMLGTGDFFLRIQKPGMAYAIQLHQCKASPWGATIIKPHAEYDRLAGSPDWDTHDAIRTETGTVRRAHRVFLFGDQRAAIYDPEAMARHILGAIFPAKKLRLVRRGA